MDETHRGRGHITALLPAVGLLLSMSCGGSPASIPTESVSQSLRAPSQRDGYGEPAMTNLTGRDRPPDSFKTAVEFGEPPFPPGLDFDPGCNQRSVESIAASYSQFDLNGDGRNEIDRLELMNFEPAEPTCAQNGASLAIVLVEPRLLASGSSQLLEQLQTYRDDLLADGFRTRFFLAETYRGVVHQDGRTLLALRRFLAAVKSAHPGLAGVTLVGSFPEASVFRRTLLRSDEGSAGRLILHPERINPRSEIVLADLDGHWEALYQPMARMERLVMQPDHDDWPRTGQFLSGAVLEQAWVEWNDVFFIQDDYVTRHTDFRALGDTVWVSIDSAQQRNPEISQADVDLANPIARPEIAVSRIDASHVAVNPDVALDREGRAPLDAQGRPQVLVYDSEPTFGWAKDAALEQRILSDYFSRNHAFRSGAFQAHPYRTSAIQALDSNLVGSSEFNDYLREADPALTSYGVDDAKHLDFVEWLRAPGVLRGVAAHGSATYMVFGGSQAPELEAALGGKPFAWSSEWTSEGLRLTPSLAGYEYGYDWALGRTLWENDVLLGSTPAFYVLGACSAQATDNEADLSYDDPTYALKNIAEVSLFFNNGLGVVGRGKVFWDLPSGFGAGIADSGRFGGGWRSAFTTDAADSSLRPGTNADGRVLVNKKAYFWSTLGDWSLKLRYK